MISTAILAIGLLAGAGHRSTPAAEPNAERPPLRWVDEAVGQAVEVRLLATRGRMW
jgi:hypothetical protein